MWVAQSAPEATLLGSIAVGDSLKATAIDAVRRLNDGNIETIMLTGDNRRSADKVARAVGVDHVVAEVMPQDKADEGESPPSGRQGRCDGRGRDQ